MHRGSVGAEFLNNDAALKDLFEKVQGFGSVF
jgi:hypothetical protein